MEAKSSLKKKNCNQGITLVSLVVTIIILIILAGISINLTIGEEGIFTLAQRAKENMEISQNEEQEKLNALYTQFNTNNIEGEGVTGGSGLYDIMAERNTLKDNFNTFKQKIADAIKDAGGTPPQNPTEAELKAFQDSIVGENGIVAKVTDDADATQEDIAEGKTAWVKGEEITGIANLGGTSNITLLGIFGVSSVGATAKSATFTVPEGYESILVAGANNNRYIYINTMTLTSDYDATIISQVDNKVRYKYGHSWLISNASKKEFTIKVTSNKGYDDDKGTLLLVVLALS